MQFKKTTAMILLGATLLSCIPGQAFARTEIKSTCNDNYIQENSGDLKTEKFENIDILYAEGNKLEYIHKKDDGIYKIVEYTSMDSKIVESDIFKLNVETDVFEKEKHNSFIISNETQATLTETFTDGSQNIVDIDLPETAIQNDEELAYRSIMDTGWVMSRIEKNVWIPQMTISAVGAAIAGIIGAAIGSPFGVTATGITASIFTSVASKVIDRNLSEIKIKGSSGYKYIRPNIYSKGDIDVYDLNGNYLGNSSWETNGNYVG